jgi:hypothetical protein
MRLMNNGSGHAASAPTCYPHTMRFAQNSCRSSLIERCSMTITYSQPLSLSNGDTAFVKIHQRRVIDVALSLLDEQDHGDQQRHRQQSQL